MAQTGSRLAVLERLPGVLRSLSLPTLRLSEEVQASGSQAHAGKDTLWRVLGVRRTLADDFQHLGLELDWPRLLGFVLAVYFAVSMFFAGGFFVLMRDVKYHFSGDLDGRLTDLEECFWMSVAHIVTIGYGRLLPASRAAYLLVTIEHFVGILLTSLLLGVVVTKASIPASKIVFSDVMLFTKRNGEDCLMFRIGNTRGNYLLHPEIRVSYFHAVNTIEGEQIFTGVPIKFTEPPVMSPCFNLTHTINAESPLYGLTEEVLRNTDGAFGVSVSGTNDRSLQTLYARKLYHTGSIRFNGRFADVLKTSAGMRAVDMSNLSTVLPLKTLKSGDGDVDKGLETVNEDEQDSNDKES